MEKYNDVAKKYYTLYSDEVKELWTDQVPPPFQRKLDYCETNNIKLEDYLYAELYYVRHILGKDIKKDKYEYFITFTLKPDASKDDALEYIKNIKRREALGVVKFEMVDELTKNGGIHWHILLTSIKSVPKNRFDYYSKKFGFLDYRRVKCGDRDEVLNYMSKANEVIEV